MLKKNKYPILEFDTDRNAVIAPAMLRTGKGRFPTHGVICYQGDTMARLKRAGRIKEIYRLKNICTEYPIYEVSFKGRKVLVVNPYVGAAMSVAMIEELAVAGCVNWISCGSAGVLAPGVSVGHLIVPKSAVRDEGISYHYLKPSREVAASPGAVKAIKATLERHGVPYLLSKTWTTDAFYRETPAKVALRRKEGCAAVDMEAAGVFAVARFRGYTAGTILYGADDVSGKDWDPRKSRDLGYIHEKIFWLAVEACLAV